MTTQGLGLLLESANADIVYLKRELLAAQRKIDGAREDRDFALKLWKESREALYWIEMDTRDPTAPNSRSNERARKALGLSPETPENKGEKMTPEQTMKSFEAAARPLIRWLCENQHPHVTVLVTPTTAELLEGQLAITVEDYVKA